VHIADNLPGSPDTLFTVLSFDTARNLFVTWTLQPDRRRPRPATDLCQCGQRSQRMEKLERSRPSQFFAFHGERFPLDESGWPGPVPMSFWYGSNLSVDPSSQKGQSWDVFMSQVVYPISTTGAATGAGPSVAQVRVTPHPMHYNDICLAGSGCIASQGNRNLADFFAVTIDHTGAAEIRLRRYFQRSGAARVHAHRQPDRGPRCAGVITLLGILGPGPICTNVSGPSTRPTIGITGNSATRSFCDWRHERARHVHPEQLHQPIGNTLTVTTRIV